MSYLLTEIALDMLGYKFYDINGTYHITDFQTMGNNIPSEIQETSLEEIMFPNGAMREAIDTNSTDSDECIEVTDLPAPTTSVNQDQLIIQNIKESINKEFENLREEIYCKKMKFIEDNIKVIRKRDRNVTITPKDLLKHYNSQERKNICDEAEMMGEFLKSVEKRLEEANHEQFKAHKIYQMEEFL